MPRAHRSKGWLGVTAALLLVGCGAAPAATTSPPPSPSPSVMPPPSPSPTVLPSPVTTQSPPPPPTATAAPTAQPAKTARPTPSPLTLTDGEQWLMNSYFGVGDCSPKRSDLPQYTYAAMECVVADGLVDRVGLYLTDRSDFARDLYVERMTQYDVALESGDCASGVPGDSAWDLRPGWDPLVSYNRIGCFVNENDHANVRVTCQPNTGEGDMTPSPGMYLGVLGSTADVAALYDWAWGSAEFREYVTTWYEQEPEPDIEPGRTPLPAICVFGWAPSDVVLP
jgi:hypothetical protein